MLSLGSACWSDSLSGAGGRHSACWTEAIVAAERVFVFVYARPRRFASGSRRAGDGANKVVGRRRRRGNGRVSGRRSVVMYSEWACKWMQLILAIPEYGDPSTHHMLAGWLAAWRKARWRSARASARGVIGLRMVNQP
jgi:hypothetical protein